MSNQPPMPTRVDIALTVREDGSREGLPVVHLTLIDVVGDTRVFQLTERVGLELIGDLAVAVKQLHYGHREMPEPWRS